MPDSGSDGLWPRGDGMEQAHNLADAMEYVAPGAEFRVIHEFSAEEAERITRAATTALAIAAE